MIQWKITRVAADGDAIIDCHYTAWITDGVNKVETEGNWYFSDTTVKKPFSEITEQDIVDLIKKESCKDNACIIESRLVEQLESLNNDKNKHLPWLPPIFTLGA